MNCRARSNKPEWRTRTRVGNSSRSSSQKVWRRSMEQISSNVYVIAGLLVAVVIFIMAVITRMYRIAGPNEALIVTGIRGTRIVNGGGTIVAPLIETARQLSLELMSFDVAPTQDLYTTQGVAVTVE